MHQSTQTKLKVSSLYGIQSLVTDITLEGEDINHIKQVEEFIYLGDVLSSTSSSQPDIRRFAEELD